MVSSSLIGVSAFFWLLNLKYNKSAFLERKNLLAFFLLSGYYLINIVGLLNTDNLAEAFFRLESKLLLLVCPLILIFNNAIDRKRFSILLSCFSFSVVASVLYCSAVVIHGNLAADIYPLSGQYFYYTYTYLAAPLEMHPTYFSAIVSLAIFYFVLTFKSNKVLASICLPVLLVFNVLLFSRGALTGFMAGLAFMALFISSSKQKIIAIASIVVFASVIAIVLQDRLKIMLHQNKEVLQRNVEVSDSYLYHVRSWYCAVEAIGQSNLLMGYGTGDEMDVLNTCYRSNGWGAMIGLKAHNEYLSETIRHGIPGFFSAPFIVDISALYQCQEQRCSYRSVHCHVYSHLPCRIPEFAAGCYFTGFV